MGISTGSRINFTEYRWDLVREPVWIFSNIITSPVAGDVIFSYNVSQGEVGKVLGYFISSTEDNTFVFKTLESSGSGSYIESNIYLNSGGSILNIFNSSKKYIYPTTSGSLFSICINIERSGFSGSNYQAGVLIGY